VRIDDLLRCLADRAVELYLDNDRLRYRAPEGSLTAKLRGDIAAHRLAIIERLRTAAAGPRQCGNCDRQNWVDNPPEDGCVRTTCGKCGRFIGYRPVGPRMA
jgi:hypothetical protein